MPIFDFKCLVCDTIFERICPSQSTDIQVCPNCISENTVRQLCSPHIVRSGTLFNRSKVPSDFKDGVLNRIKKNYGSSSDTIKT